MKYWIITILLLTTITTRGQYINDTISKFLLEKEFIYWQSKTDSEKFYVLIEKAEIYTHIEAYENALLELNRSEKLVLSNNTDSTLLKYKKMLNHFLSKNYIEASRINLKDEELKKINKMNEYNMMILISLNETEQWELCKEKLKIISDSTNQLTANRIKLLPIAYKFRSPDNCYNLSGFLPGLGQITAGYTFKGITSFLIQIGLITFIASNVITGFYIMGLVSGVFPLLKFYNGGKRLSFSLALKKNNKEKAKLKKKYFQIIEDITLPSI